MLGEVGEVWFCSNRNCNTKWYIDIGKKPNITNCQKCGGYPIKSILMTNEYFYIKSISEDRDFIDAMIELKQKDIIEFKTKISQFKTQVDAQENRKRQEQNKPQCPKCGSTNITTGQRGYSLWTGFLGSNKTVNRCSNCGYSWQPKK